jgi:hypothetical protein
MSSWDDVSSACYAPTYKYYRTPLHNAIPKTGYKRNIHSIADLMILTKSNTFVGEFVSNWGRIVRIFRAHLHDKYVIHDNLLRWGAMTREDETIDEERPVLFHDTRIAFG